MLLFSIPFLQKGGELTGNIISQESVFCFNSTFQIWRNLQSKLYRRSMEVQPL